MDDEVRRVKGSQAPEGTMFGTLVATEGQCGKEGCDSWKTVGVEIDSLTDLGEDDGVFVYSICLKHLGEFVQDVFLDGVGLYQEGCGDPDCEACNDDYSDDLDDEDG